MRVLIAGGGVAGLTLALSLVRAGHEPIVVEQAPGLSGEAGLLDFFNGGYDVAERLGLLGALEGLRAPLATLSCVDRDGHPTSTLAYEAVRRVLGGRHLYVLQRDLIRVLFEAIAGSLPIRFGLDVAAFEEHPQGLRCTLSNGSELEVDLLVGADRLASRVRGLLFADGPAPLHRLGLRQGAVVLTGPQLAPETYPALLLPGRMVSAYPMGDGRVAATMLYHESLAPKGATAAAELQAVFGDLGWIVPAILAGWQDGELQDVAQVMLPSWSRGRVVLLGDACQAVAPVVAQSASLAMASAALLADQLADGKPLAEALATYEQLARPTIHDRQAAGRRFARWFRPDVAADLAIQDMAMRLAGHGWAEFLLRRELDVLDLAEAD